MASLTPKQDKRMAQLLGFLKQDPSNARLRVDVFEAAMALGDFTEAGATVAQALLDNPEDANWLHREATLLLATGHFDRAERALLSLGGEDPADPVIRHDLAFACSGQGKFEEAEALLRALKAEEGTLGSLVWALWLRCEHNLYHLEEGIRDFRIVSPRIPVQPSWSEAWGAASLMAFDAGHLDEAKQWSDRALHENPEQMEALATKGSLALGHQDAQAAQACFERALRVHPKDGRSWSGLAFTRFLALDIRGAQEAFRQALTFMPTHIGTWIGLGWSELLAKRPSAALEAFEQAVALDRNFGESHGALAIALVQVGQRDRAETEVELALRLDPQGLSARYARAMLKGEASDFESFQRFARQILEQRPALFPDEGQTSRTLADVVLRRFR